MKNERPRVFYNILDWRAEWVIFTGSGRCNYPARTVGGTQIGVDEAVRMRRSPCALPRKRGGSAAICSGHLPRNCSTRSRFDAADPIAQGVSDRVDRALCDSGG